MSVVTVFVPRRVMEVERSVLVVAVLFVLISCVLAQQGMLNSSNEKLALLQLRSSLGLRARDWPRRSDPCTNWTGVHCLAGRVSSLNISGLQRTRLGRENPQFAVDSLVNLTRLVSFNASGFLLPGAIPDWLGYGLPVLQVLDLSSCAVNGAIPVSLADLSGLQHLNLSSNSLTGSMVSTLGQLKELSVLDISRNMLTGPIPPELSQLSKLVKLDLSSNFMSGTIPANLGNLHNLQVLNLSDNSFTGSIPVQLGNLSQLNVFDISDNALNGQLPVGLISSLRRLQVLVLSGNELNGTLTDELWSSSALQSVDVSGNNFTDVLPSVDSNINFTLAVYNLSNNILYGPLNFSIGLFKSIDLSGNYFQGELLENSQSKANLSKNCLQKQPNQRSLEDCRLFYSQRGLIFDDFGPPGSEAQPTTESNNRWKFILIGVFSGFGFIILLVFLLVLLLRKCNRRVSKERDSAGVGPVSDLDSQAIPREHFNMSSLVDSFTYEQIVRTTYGFNESNLIKHGHTGDLYQGILEGGCPVVIKRIDLGSLGRESYMRELEFYSKISHVRLVPLLGHCLEHENEKILVYKYMPNGDLASSFYRPTESEDDSLQSLDWITRLKIATGAAECLSYLHHDCDPPIVHRDVQASSILLDDKFEVRLGSLSEVCAQEGDNHHNVITRFLRKPQTSEHGLPGSVSATCAYDVFCFGKVLLELVTGKIGISKLDDATTREWLDYTLPYISIHDKDLVTKIIDPSLIVDEDLLEEVWAMAIVARSCMNPKPSKRPPMRYVLKALENPLKVVREDSGTLASARLRTTSSRRSWNSFFLGSWRHNSSESGAVPGLLSNTGFRQPARIGSHSSGGNDHSSSHKRVSSEIFPEPLGNSEMERLDAH